MAIKDLYQNLGIISRERRFKGKTVKDLMKLRNLGTLSVEEIVTTLAKYGIQIPEDNK